MKKPLITSLMVALTLMLAACSKLNQENYDKLDMGMDKAEVQQIIGSPDTCSESLGTTTCIWGKEDGKHVKISFVGGKAVMFSHQGLE